MTHGPWTTAVLANRLYDDVGTLAAAVAMDHAGVPMEAVEGLTVIETGEPFWARHAYDVAVIARVWQGKAEAADDPRLQVWVYGYRGAVDWEHVLQQRRIVVAVARISDIAPSDAQELVGSGSIFKLRIDKPMLRGFLSAWFSLDGDAVDEAGLASLRASDDAWAKLDVKRLGLCLFARRPVDHAIECVAELLHEYDEPPADEDRNDDALEALVRDGTGKSAQKPTSVVKPLSEMHGFGAAGSWGMDLVRDLKDYASGEIAWDDVDRGVVIVGPPGCGKTTFAKSLALEAGIKFIPVTYANFETGSGGYVVKSMKKAFDEWRKAADSGPVVVFWDEIDSMGARNQNAHNDSYWTAIINCLLDFLDGATPREGIVMIAATNHLDRVDPALRRAGRLDRIVEMEPPSGDAQRAILASHLRCEPDAEGLEEALRWTRELSPAAVERTVRDARRLARRFGRTVHPADVADLLRFGTERDPEVEAHVAVHEAGHAVAAAFLGIPIRYVRMGHVVTRNRRLVTPASVLDDMTFTLAAGAAEEAVFGSMTNGWKMDLSDATRQAADYHGGMGFGTTLLHQFRVDGRTETVSMSPDLVERCEATMREQYERARALVTGRLHLVRRLATALRERRHLDGAEVDEVLRFDWAGFVRHGESRWERDDRRWEDAGDLMAA